MMKFSMTNKLRSSLFGYFFISPWIIGFLLFFASPIFRSIRFSISKINMESAGHNIVFVGLNNFERAFTVDPNFPVLLVDSLKNVLLDVPVVLIFSFFVALLLKQNFKGNAIVKAIFFLPVIMSSGIFIMLQSQYSGLNTLAVDSIMDEGVQSIKVLQSINISQYMLEAGLTQQIVDLLVAPINRIYDVISESGIQIFIYLAGLHSIPPHLYEAFYIEGATGWETFWKLTFPMLSPLILVNTIYSIIDKFTSFKTESMNYIYDMAFKSFDFGLSSAMAWTFFMALSIVLFGAAILISKRVFYHT